MRISQPKLFALLIIIITALITLACVFDSKAQEVSKDPLFSIYTNDTLSVTSITINPENLTKEFKGYKHIDCTIDGYWFDIEQGQYMFYIPQTCQKIVVRSNKNVYIGDHLLYLLDYVRKNQKKLICQK